MANELSISNPYPRKLPGPQLLHELVPRDTPNGVAAIEWTSEENSTSRLEYSEFHRRAEALARRIITAAKRDTRCGNRFIVPILIPQSLDLYISQLASLKAGGAFCPIVLDAPEERLRFILEDVEASVLLTTMEAKPRLPLLNGIEIISVDEENPTTDEGSIDSSHITPQDAAYVMYTSGSTGQPKGVVISHGAATQALLAHDPHIPSFSRFLQFASPTFDVSVFEIFFPWYRQSTLISCDRKRLLNDLPSVINQLEIDACELTPSVASSLLRGRNSVPGLKVLLTIGEMLKPSVVEEFGGDSSELAVLHGMYGPTEATIHCTLQTCFPKDMPCGMIGQPLETVSAFVIKLQDEASSHGQDIQVLPLGEEGELAVGGHQLADGYLNREEQTKAAFVQHPEFGRLYRTGDRARMLQNGTLECLGRISAGQVKLRGQRIELGEIEYAASKAQGCRDIVAEVIQGILVVFCVRKDQSATRASVLATCRAWLPSFMVPGEVVMLEDVPYLASGKCDRKALKQSYMDSRRDQDDTSAETDETVLHVAKIVGDILNVTVNPDSILPGLGVDSLSSIRIAGSLRQAGFRQLDAMEVLTAHTVTDIATTLQREPVSERQEKDDVYRAAFDDALPQALPPDQLADVEESFPCTSVQTAMLAETSKQAHMYWNWVELLVPGCRDSSALATSLHQLANMHPMLRAGFVPMSESQWSFATVIWKRLKPEQVLEVSSFNYSFDAQSDSNLLRGCSFQLVLTSDGCRILFKAHHSLFDQWSIDLLRRDLGFLLKGRSLEPAVSFKEVAIHHIEHLNEGSSHSAIDFWQQHLRDASPTTLPLLRAEVTSPSLCRTNWREFSQDISSLKSLSKDLNCSLPSIFQAAWALLLGAYTGSSDVTFGSIFSGRNLPINDIDSIFGPCLATLPLHIDSSSASTCADLLRALTESNRAMQKHVLTPATSIREAAGVSPGTTLFDTIFVWQESTVIRELYDSGVHVEDSRDELEFNLVLEFEPSQSKINARVTYQQSLINSEQIDLLLRQIDAVASSILEWAERPVKDLWADMDPHVLSIVNPRPTSFADKYDLISTIESHATRSNPPPAILFARSQNEQGLELQSISYAGLNERANRVAHHFIAAGLQPGGLVSICMEKSVDLYVAILASFKAGAGYLPMMPETPDARLKSILSQTTVDICVCDSDILSTFQRTFNGPVVVITKADLSSYPSTAPPVPQAGDRTAYAVFTSGSTGEPKGVAVTMNNLKGNLAVLSEMYQVHHGDRLLQACSQAFDVSVFEIFFTFYSGMTLCTATKDIMFQDFEQTIRNFQATHLSLTPTVAALVRPENVPSVRFLVTAGEGITERVHRSWSGKGLHQGYGPSETTNICSVKMNHAPGDVLGNIGPPFKNTSAFVISPEGEFTVLPAGAYGEFAFGGEQVFHGYINRNDLTCEKVINRPQFGRVYKSGDMGRILPDGTLLISGRVDDQVKIRGNRVELGEINAVVSDHADVSDCTTIVHGDDSSTQTLVTYFVPISSQKTPSSTVEVVTAETTLVADIFRQLEDAIPAYMVPSTLVPVNRLPITLQGKLDKRLLRQVLENLGNSQRDKFSRSHEVDSNDKPATPNEEAMANILSSIVGVPMTNISRNTSFFALGLNSLNAIQFAKQLQGKLETVVGVSAVLKHSSISRLAEFMSKSAPTQISNDESFRLDVFSEDIVNSLKSTLRTRNLTAIAILPCTPLQQAMLSASVSDGNEAYCSMSKLTVHGDVDRLRSIWDSMVERHAILRTCFAETSSATHPFAQIVLERAPKMWHDESKRSSGTNDTLNGHTNGTTNGHTNGHANGITNGHANGMNNKLPGFLTPVTPESPVRVIQQRSDLYLQMHHAIYDGISVSNLFNEITQLYNGQSLPAPVSFEPFLAEVMRQNGDEALRFWSERIRGFRPNPFPIREATHEHHEEALDRSVPCGPQELQAFCEKHSCTPLSVFQAAWAKALTCAQHSSDICFGNVVSGRSVPVPDVDRLIAPCFNTIPSRSRIASVRTNLGLIQKLHQDNIDTLPFQHTASRRIQTLSNEPSMHLFDSLLLVQPEQEDSDLWAVEEYGMDMGIPLAVEVIPRDTGYEVLLHYMLSRVSDSQAEAIADAFVAGLLSCIRYPSSAVEQFIDFDTSRIAGSLKPSHTQAKANGVANGRQDGQWSETEAAVRSTFSELAAVSENHISKKTSLYQIGLDSLNAVQVASALRRQGFKLDVADVMQYQTPAALGQYLDADNTEEGPAGSALDLGSFDRDQRQRIVTEFGLSDEVLEAVRPCTPSQNGMIAQFIQSQGAYYMSHSVYEIPEAISFEVIKDAWAAVEQKHMVLRMGFCQLEDAATPFAMIVYQPGVFFDKVMMAEALLEEDSFEQAARKDVLHSFHLPAWRVHLSDSADGREMCLSLHHALYDADALQVLLTDFARAIDGQRLGAAPTIDQAVINQLSGVNEGKTAGEKFWTDALQTARVVKFPNLTPTLITESRAEVARHSSSLMLADVENFCKHAGVTIQALGQSVWALLLSQYLGESEVTFGTVLSGASNTSQHIAFPTISTLPVACNAGKDAADLLQDMVSYNASIQRHRFTPLTDIQRYAGSAGQALFDTIFVYQKSADAEDVHFDWHATTDSLSVDYVASMEMEIPESSTVKLRLTYDTQAIPTEHASLMIKQFDMILHEVLGIEQHRSKDVPLLSYVAEKEPVIPCSVDLLHQFIERGAESWPDRSALEFIHTLEGGQKSRKTWTYKQLNERSNQVARLIQQHGVTPGSIVGVCMSKSAEASFAFAGILKAGCAFLAMDPDLPIARKQFIMEDSAAQLLFVDARKADPDLETVVRNTELSEEMLAQFAQSPASLSSVSPSATSYCLYTSGTTGTPKGCELTHDNAVQAMMSFQRLFAGHWDEHSRWLQFASYWFDVSVLEQFWSWSVGITVVVAPRDVVLEDLAGFITSANITHIDLTPSLARLLTPDQVPSLWNHVFITGGEALKQEIIDRWGPHKTICNGYGPTEATIGVTMNRFIGPDAKPSNIGPPFDNVGAYVFAPGTDELVLRGAVGELCVSGKLVGKGYLNRPDLTAKAFPYLERHGERVYRTGDLVRLLADGSVSFIGRADTQAKLRGQRLEIDEIDSVIKSSAETISDVASLVVKSSEGSREMLVSFVVNDTVRSKDLEVSTSDQSLELVQVADQACRDHLPGYMVPTHFIPLTRLPLTVNNKVDTKRLVALFTSMDAKELQHLKGNGNAQREMSAIEKKIAESLARLLSIEVTQMTSESNLFSLGLSSVTAINFATVLKRAGLKTASVAMIMKHPTIHSLGKSISGSDEEGQLERNAIKQAQLSISAFAQRYRGQAAKVLSAKVSDIESIAPCTPLQEGLLVESLKSSQRPYFNRFWFDVTGLDLERICSAIGHLGKIVPMLRTAFLNVDEGFAQVIFRNREVLCQVFSVENDTQENVLDQRKRDWASAATDDVLHPFEALIVRTDDKALLAFHAHHALYDGISWDLTIDLLSRLYQSSEPTACGPSFVEALPYGPLCQQPDAKQFWQQKLQNTPFSPMNPNIEGVVAQDLATTKTISFDPRLEALRKDLAVSHQAIMQSAFMVALHQFSPKTTTYGVVLSGRSIAFDGAEQVIGPMFNTVPEALELRPSDQWRQLLLRCHQANTAVVPFQHTPLRSVRKFCERHPSDPMFDVLFVFQRPTSETSSQDQTLFKQIDPGFTADYPLAVEIELDGSGNVNIMVTAQARFASAESLEAVTAHIEQALNSIIHNVDDKISSDFDIQTQHVESDSDHAQNQDVQLGNSADFEWTAEATLLREQIAELAGCQPQDINEATGIFTLGLDSIDAVKLASRLKKAGLSIPVSQMLKAQTIANMMGLLESERLSVPKSSTESKFSVLKNQLEPLRHTFDEDLQANIERIVPATPGQEALIADMVRSGFQEYFNSDVLELHSSVNVEKLREAWRAVIGASPILRTSFAEVTDPDIDAVFAQVVHKPEPFEIAELTVKTMEDVDRYIEQLRIDVMATFANVPPIRLAVATLEDKNILILSMAHALYDGHSLALLHEDVGQAYHDKLESRPVYDNVIGSALEATTGKALQFWKSTLNGAKVTHMDKEDDLSVSTVHREEQTMRISASSARELCKSLGVSLQALAHTCWTLLLANHTKQLEVLFGIVLACRDSEESEQAMFPTMNTVPLRASLHGSGSEMMRYVQSINNDIRPYQRTPLRAIQAVCSDIVQAQDARDGAGLFDSLFIFQQRPESLSQDQEPLYKSINANSSVEYPVALEAEALGDNLVVRVACKSNVFDQTGTQDLLDKFDHVLEQLVKSPDTPVVSFSGDSVSLCGLPAFQLQDNEVSAEAQDDQSTDDAIDIEQELPFEAQIRAALAQVAKVSEDEVTSSTKMEAIGIDSISAIKVTALLRKESIKLPVSSIIKAQTPKRMAELVESNSPTPTPTTSATDIIANHLGSLNINEVAKANGVEPDNVESVMPATPGQLYMYSMWRLTEGQLFYPVFRYAVKTDHPVERLRSAWDAVVARNSILRTSLVQGNSAIRLLQVVLKQWSESTSPRPLVSMSFDETDDGYNIGLKIHHALYDAVSLPLLMADFEAALNVQTPASPRIQLSDYVAQALSAEAQQARRDFWSKYLDDVQPTMLLQPQSDKLLRKVQIFKPEAFTKGAELERTCRTAGISVQALLFAIYAKVFAGQTRSANNDNSSDVVFGIYLANRSLLPDLDQLAAPTLNILPLLVGKPKDRKLVDIAKQVDADLRSIGSKEVAAGSSLAEIAELTGVKIDSCVNFLKLPESDGKPEEETSTSVIKEVDEWTKEVCEVQEMKKSSVPDHQRDFQPSEAYQHAVDVEFSLQNGKLSIGLFCLEEMLSLEQGKEFVGQIKRELEGLVE